jgi:membrane peptidoglycan carboxypeptidase
MKKLIVSLAVASAAMIAAAPASAQGWGRGNNIQQRLQRIEVRIDRNAQRGSLTRNEAQRLRAETNGVQRLAWRYSRNGVTAWEHRDLERRVDRLQNRLQRQRHDDQRRWRR